MNKKLILIFILITTMMFNAFSYESENLEYLYFDLDESGDTGIVAYSLYYNENIQQGDVFNLDVYSNNKLIDTCEILLKYDDEDVFEKITCEIKKDDDGEYIFDAKILRKNNIVFQIKNKENFLGYTKSNIEFNEKNEKTEIIINIEGKGNNLIVYNKIPKSIISSLTEKNKENLINTNYEYDIIEEDPLIAWNIDEAPIKINYTINKKISQKERENFSLTITDKKEFKLFKYIIILLILLIIAISLKPIVKKKKKK